MQPAFDSTRQAAAFALLLLVLLLLPALLSKSLLPPRQEIYGWTGWDSTGPHPYHEHLIFEEKGDIDIAFVGSSQITHGIDTRYVQEKLSAMLGRQATVRTLGWGGGGYDALYFMTKDFLENRKIKMIVFYDECQTHDLMNSLARNWFRFGDDAEALAGLPLTRQMTYYFAAIFGAPKNIVGMVRSNLPADMSAAKMEEVKHLYHSDNIMEALGSLASYHGFNYSPNLDENTYGPFVEYIPETKTQPSDVAIYSPATQAEFKFDGPAVPAWQLHFAKKFAALAQQYGVKLVLLHLPHIQHIEEDRQSTVIREREFWPDVLQTDITMVGIPPATLFQGMSDEEVRKLFSDSVHLNKNGQIYFTSLVTPALLEIYAQQIHH